MHKMRLLGMCLLVFGVLLVASWFIEPLRNAWPAFWAWFVATPSIIRIGLAIGIVGFAVVFVSLIIERAQDHRREGDLSDEP